MGHRVEHSFEIGDVVFLRVQPHRLFPFRRGGGKRMRSHLCGPYKVIWRVGEIAYETEFPKGSRIRSILYVSCLEKALGPRATTSTELPPLDERGQMILTPEEVLDATWESEKILQHFGLRLLEISIIEVDFGLGNMN
jgi:hypothetical protein